MSKYEIKVPDARTHFSLIKGDYPEYSIHEFEMLAEVDLSDQPNTCPVHTCGRELSVVWDGECFTLWCTHCTWEPADGFDQPVRYISINDVAAQNPIFDADYLRWQCRAGALIGRKMTAGSGGKSTWCLPTFTVRRLAHKPDFNEQYLSEWGYCFG